MADPLQRPSCIRSLRVAPGGYQRLGPTPRAGCGRAPRPGRCRRRLACAGWRGRSWARAARSRRRRPRGAWPSGRRRCERRVGSGCPDALAENRMVPDGQRGGRGRLAPGLEVPDVARRGPVRRGRALGVQPGREAPQGALAASAVGSAMPQGSLTAIISHGRQRCGPEPAFFANSPQHASGADKRNRTGQGFRESRYMRGPAGTFLSALLGCVPCVAPRRPQSSD